MRRKERKKRKRGQLNRVSFTQPAKWPQRRRRRGKPTFLPIQLLDRWIGLNFLIPPNSNDAGRCCYTCKSICKEDRVDVAASHTLFPDWMQMSIHLQLRVTWWLKQNGSEFKYITFITGAGLICSSSHSWHRVESCSLDLGYLDICSFFPFPLCCLVHPSSCWLVVPCDGLLVHFGCTSSCDYVLSGCVSILLFSPPLTCPLFFYFSVFFSASSCSLLPLVLVLILLLSFDSFFSPFRFAQSGMDDLSYICDISLLVHEEEQNWRKVRKKKLKSRDNRVSSCLKIALWRVKKSANFKVGGTIRPLE